MDKKVITSDKAPKAIGPYSVAIRTNDLVFTSGQLGLDPATGVLVTDPLAAGLTLAIPGVPLVPLWAAGLPVPVALVVAGTAALKSMREGERPQDRERDEKAGRHLREEREREAGADENRREGTGAPLEPSHEAEKDDSS